MKIGGLGFDIFLQTAETSSQTADCIQQAERLVLAWNVSDPLVAVLQAMVAIHERSNDVDPELLNQTRDALTVAGARR